MNARTLRKMLPLLGVTALSVGVAWADPPPPRRPGTPARVAPARRPARGRAAPPVVPADVPPVVPEIVAVDAGDLQNTLARLRIYVMNAPDGSRALGNLGAGVQLWFLLPSCRPPQPDDPRDMCPIDRLELDAVRGGSVRTGRMSTVMAGEIPRRAQAFVVGPDTPLVRIRLVTPAGVLHYEGVIAATEIHRLPAPVGRDRETTFDFDFSRYPGR